jgi:hypothetical protein
MNSLLHYTIKAEASASQIFTKVLSHRGIKASSHQVIKVSRDVKVTFTFTLKHTIVFV